MDTSKNTEKASAPGKFPAKYIRTYLSDMDIFQRGGTPSLAPMKESIQPPLKDDVFPEQSLQPVPTVAPLAPLVPSPAQLKVPVGFEVERIQTPIPTPVPTVVKQPVLPAKVAKTIAEPVLAPIETYSDDFRKRVEEKGSSTASVLAAEQDLGKHVSDEIPEESKGNRNKWYVISGIVLLCVGGIGVYVAYSKYLVALAPVSILATATAPIFVNDQKTVSGTGNDLMRAIQKLETETLPRDTVRQISLDESTTASAGANVFLALDVHAPDILIRNMKTDGSMAGIVDTSTSQAPFFILPVGAYSTTFAGMLLWEPTMQTDLAMLYPLYPVVQSTQPEASSTLATTTVATTTVVVPIVAKIGFRDEVVGNHDVRVLRDASGRSIVLYGYWNQTTLIIARDPMAFAEILDRLATSHT